MKNKYIVALVAAGLLAVTGVGFSGMCLQSQEWTVSQNEVGHMRYICPCYAQGGMGATTLTCYSNGIIPFGRLGTDSISPSEAACASLLQQNSYLLDGGCPT